MGERKTVISAENVCKYFDVKGSSGKNKSKVKAVDGVSLQIYKGETYGLVGESGCGKSTLGRTLIRLLEPTSGKIMLGDRNIAEIPQKEMRALRKKVQMVFQDPYTSLNPRKRVGDILMEALAIHNMGDKNSRMNTAMEILDKVGLRPEHFYRYPHEFSGGQKQRAAVARALITHPQIILADEPTGALDSKSTDDLLNIFDHVNEEGQTIVMVTHSTKAASFAKRVLFIRDGQVYHQIYKGDKTNEEMYQAISDTLTLLQTGGK